MHYVIRTRCNTWAIFLVRAKTNIIRTQYKSNKQRGACENVRTKFHIGKGPNYARDYMKLNYSLYYQLILKQNLNFLRIHSKRCRLMDCPSYFENPFSLEKLNNLQKVKQCTKSELQPPPLHYMRAKNKYNQEINSHGPRTGSSGCNFCFYQLY